jgi:hypothetical protein
MGYDGETTEVAMFLALFYFFVGFLFVAAALLDLVSAPPAALWFCAGVFLLLGGWRALHLSRG